MQQCGRDTQITGVLLHIATAKAPTTNAWATGRGGGGQVTCANLRVSHIMHLSAMNRHSWYTSEGVPQPEL